MSISLLYLWMSIKNRVALRIDFFGSFVILFLTLFFTTLYFLNFFNFTSHLGGLNRSQMIFLYLTSLMQVFFIRSFFASIDTFFEKLQRGQIEPHLTKPLSVYRIVFLRWFSVSPFAWGIIFLFICCTYALTLSTPTRVLLYGVGLLLGIGANLSFLLFLESFTFLSKRLLPIFFIFSELTRVMQLPLLIYPKAILIYLVIFFPMFLSSALSVDVLIKGGNLLFLIYAGVCLGLMPIGLAFFSFLFRTRFDGYGG